MTSAPVEEANKNSLQPEMMTVLVINIYIDWKLCASSFFRLSRFLTVFSNEILIKLFNAQQLISASTSATVNERWSIFSSAFVWNSNTMNSILFSSRNGIIGHLHYLKNGRSRLLKLQALNNSPLLQSIRHFPMCVCVWPSEIYPHLSPLIHLHKHSFSQSVSQSLSRCVQWSQSVLDFSIVKLKAH